MVSSKIAPAKAKTRGAGPDGHKDTTAGRKDHKAKDTSGWLTRHEASATLSLSAQTLANYERRGLLHPQYSYRRDVHNIDRRVVVYDPHELSRLRPYRPYNRGAVAPRDPGEVAARAFEMFRAGRSDEEVVVELRLEPDAVCALHERWLEMSRAALVISPNAKAALEKIVGPFSDVTELVEKLVKRLEIRDRLDGELAPRASVPPARRWVAEILSTGMSAPDAEAVEAAAQVTVGPAVELSGDGASCDTTSAPDTSSNEASVNEESVGPPVVAESVSAVPSGSESVGDPVSERRAVDGGSGPEGGASGIGACETPAVRSPREQLLDEWLESLVSDDARLLRLAGLLKREELEMLAELERGIGVNVAALKGSRSPREQLLDVLLVSLTEDAVRLEEIGAMLTASELDMLSRLKGVPASN